MPVVEGFLTGSSAPLGRESAAAPNRHARVKGRGPTGRSLGTPPPEAREIRTKDMQFAAPDAKVPPVAP